MTEPNPQDRPLTPEEIEIGRAAMEEAERLIAEAKRNGTWEPERGISSGWAERVFGEVALGPPDPARQAHDEEIRRRAVDDPEALQEELDQRFIDLADPEDADDPNLPDYIREQIRQKFQERRPGTCAIGSRRATIVGQRKGQHNDTVIRWLPTGTAQSRGTTRSRQPIRSRQRWRSFLQVQG